jgi:hypothetical protein
MASTSETNVAIRGKRTSQIAVLRPAFQNRALVRTST